MIMMMAEIILLMRAVIIIMMAVVILIGTIFDGVNQTYGG